MTIINDDFEGVVLGMGNPLLDITADVKQEFLDKYKLKLNNAILAEEPHMPIYKDLVDNFDVEYTAGGATQNTIRICQWMLQKPNATSYIGSVGDDNFGAVLKKSANDEGVAVYYHVAKGIPTGTCAVLVQSHERSLVANLGAANAYKIDHLISADIEPVWKKAKFVYIAGFFLTVSPPSIMHLAEHCATNNKVFAMNLAAPFIAEFFMEPLLKAITYCDIVIGNENESMAFAKKSGMEDTSPEAVARAIAALPKSSPSKKDRIVIITQGPNPTVVATCGKTDTYPVPHIPDEELVDLNGAGDAFVGGLLAYLAQGRSIAEAVNAGHYSAGVVARRSGCTVSGKPQYIK